MKRLRDLLPEPLFTRLYVGGRDGELCMAFGGNVGSSIWDQRVRVCDKPRGHFDSHTYEFLDELKSTASCEDRP